MRITDLEDLKDAIEADFIAMQLKYGDELPVFCDEEPAAIGCIWAGKAVWSYDDTRLLIGPPVKEGWNFPDPFKLEIFDAKEFYLMCI